MSVWFRSYIYYGVKLDYDKFKELKGNFDWTEDGVSMNDSPDNIGWEADGMNGDWALFGKLLMDGTDGGGYDSPLGGDGHVTKLRLLSPKEKKVIQGRIAEEVGAEYANLACYFVVGQYS